MYLGQEHRILGDWFIFHFTENNGMAFGLQLGGDSGKLFLTSFRIIAVFGIFYYLLYQIKHKAKTGLIVCISLVLAGAIGNIIDSVFYGVWFNDNYNEYLDNGTLKWTKHAPYFYGRVVDMLYFPVLEGRYPDWFPFWGGESFLFFRPVFNIADTSISFGVFSIILFQKYLFPQETNTKDSVSELESDIDSEIEIDSTTVSNTESNLPPEEEDTISTPTEEV